MSNWGFWEWLTYLCIAIAAIILASDAAIKGAPGMLSGLSGLLRSPIWNFAPIVFITISAGLILLTHLGWVGKPTAEPSATTSTGPQLVPVQQIVGQTFDGVRIDVDNKWFIDCTFKNVTIIWQGGFFQWQNSHYIGTVNLVSQNPGVVGTIDILKGFGFLTPEFAASWKHYPPGQTK